MKLLLDEMYPPAIATQLQARGHDVDAVTERPELRALADLDLFALAQREQRVLVTENVADFAAIANDHDGRGQVHHGLVLLHPGSHPRGNPRTIGRMVDALQRLLGERSGTAPTSMRHWL